MENKNFFLRLLSLFLIVMALFFYNSMLENKQSRMLAEELSSKVDTLEQQIQVLNDNVIVTSEQLEAVKEQQKELIAALADTEEEKAAEETTEKNKKEEQEEEQTELIYQNGKFTGEGQGFGGNIQVEITMKEDVLEDIKILSASGEDAAYLNLAKDVIDQVLSQQSTDVDAISGATFSSTGILIAIEDALGKAEKQS